MATFRQKTWIWGHPKNSLSGKFGLKDGNDATPVEGMKYLGARNVFWVLQGNDPFDENHELELMQQSCDSFGWCIYKNANADKIISQSKRFPSYKRCVYDDFFDDENINNYKTISKEELLSLKSKLNAAGMELWVVIYERNIHMDIAEFLPCFDGFSFWFWRQPTPEEYHKTLKIFFDKTPDKKRLLGCYLYDFGREKPCDPQLLKKELENDAILMKNGDIEGIILHTNAVSGFGFEGYDLAAKWMEENGDVDI